VGLVATVTAAVLVGLGLVGPGLVGGRPALATSGPANQTLVSSQDIPNLSHVKDRIRAYYGDVVDAAGLHQASAGSSYAAEVAVVESAAMLYLSGTIQVAGAARPAVRHPHKDPAIVLDVDDTSLMTYVYEANHDFGLDPATNAVAVAHGFPAVFGMPALAVWATAHGYSVFFVSSRPDSQHQATLANLTAVGFPTSTTALSRQGDDLFTMPADPTTVPYLHCDTDGNPTCTTTEFKSSTRAYLQSQGYDIAANVGDQLSDLAGGHQDRAFRLPNPMYWMP
jgi:hypothetical protein